MKEKRTASKSRPPIQSSQRLKENTFRRRMLEHSQGHLKIYYARDRHDFTSSKRINRGVARETNQNNSNDTRTSTAHTNNQGAQGLDLQTRCVQTHTSKAAQGDRTVSRSVGGYHQKPPPIPQTLNCCTRNDHSHKKQIATYVPTRVHFEAQPFATKKCMLPCTLWGHL